MVRKLSLLVGLGAGYVLGARSGRARYEQISAKAQELWRDPRVQEKAEQAQEFVKSKSPISSSGSDSDDQSLPDFADFSARHSATPTPGTAAKASKGTATPS